MKRLEQNFPNPFNPSATIQYELPHASRVTLKVYSTLGQEVATVMNETKPAGVHTVEFDAAELSSGVCFYRLEAGNFVETREMALVRQCIVLNFIEEGRSRIADAREISDSRVCTARSIHDCQSTIHNRQPT